MKQCRINNTQQLLSLAIIRGSILMPKNDQPLPVSEYIEILIVVYTIKKFCDILMCVNFINFALFCYEYMN